MMNAGLKFIKISNVMSNLKMQDAVRESTFVIETTILCLIRFCRSTKKILKEMTKKDEIERKFSQEATHRIKNNLQLINSLLKIQARNYKDLSVAEFHRKSYARLTPISLIHENVVYENQEELVDISSYLTSLISMINEAFEFQLDEIDFDLVTNNIQLKLSKAISLGLIINELIMNSITHAFKNEGQEKKITLHLMDIDGTCELIYKDNGVGFNYPEKKDSLGLEIISLLTLQLKGHMSINTEIGTEYIFCFDNTT